MDIIGIGFWEIIVILVVAVIIVGPRRLPEIARKMGQIMGKFRMTTTELTRSITAEVEEEANQMHSEGHGLKKELNDIVEEAKEER